MQSRRPKLRHPPVMSVVLPKNSKPDSVVLVMLLWAMYSPACETEGAVSVQSTSTPAEHTRIQQSQQRSSLHDDWHDAPADISTHRVAPFIDLQLHLTDCSIVPQCWVARHKHAGGFQGVWLDRDKGLVPEGPQPASAASTNRCKLRQTSQQSTSPNLGVEFA